MTENDGNGVKIFIGRQLVVVLLLICCLLLPAGGGATLTSPPRLTDESTLEEKSAPVVVDGITLFRVRGVSAYPAEKRAQAIADRIVALATDPAFDKQALRLEDQVESTAVMAGGRMVMVISDSDARLEGIDRHLLGRSIRWRIGEAIGAWRRDRVPATLQRNALIALGATLLLVVALWGVVRLFRRLRGFIEQRVRQRIQDVKLQQFHLVRAHQLWGMLSGLLHLFGTLTVLTIFYLYLSNVLALFPWTRWLAENLATLLLVPLHTLGLGFLKSVPKLAFLVVLCLFSRYLLKLIRLFFDNIADGSVVLPGFESEWATPTYRLLRILLVAFTVVVAYPYIPGSETDAFKGVSIFIGVIFSLGSSSLIGNIIAGYTMTYRRAFRIGDRVRIGANLGDVEQVRMLVTHLRTPKNEEVVIPNSLILASEVVNYSTLARQQGLILHTTVGIGYETPWRQVEAMLLEAAGRTPGLLRSPAPFVLHTLLGDFCVTYELNVYCGDPQAMLPLYTELHRNILDVFNEYDVQIMTPAYRGDPEQPKVVPREQWYAAPARPPEPPAA